LSAINPASKATISRDPGRGPEAGNLLLVKGIAGLLADFAFGCNFGLHLARYPTKGRAVMKERHLCAG